MANLDEIDQSDSLKIGLALILISVIATAGIATNAFILTDDDSSTDNPEKDTLYAIPDDADMVIQADPIGFTEDPVTVHTANTIIDESKITEESYEYIINQGFDTVDVAINDNLESHGAEDVDIDIRDFDNVILFGDTEDLNDGFEYTENITEHEYTDDDPYVGMIIEFDVSEEDINSLMEIAEEETGEIENIERESYNGQTIYEIEGEERISVGVLDEAYVIGTSEVVKDSINAYNEEDDRLDDKYRPNLETNTYFSMIMSDFDEQDVYNYDEIPSDAELDGEVDFVQMSYSTDGEDTAKATLNVKADDETIDEMYDEISSDIGENDTFGEFFEVDVNTNDDTINVLVSTDTDSIDEMVSILFNYISDQNFIETQLIG